MSEFNQDETLINLTADIVAAHVSNNTVATSEIATLINTVYGALSTAGKDQIPEPENRIPAVSIRSSVKPDHLVCLTCGKKQTMLKRHVHSAHGMTPEQYRDHWNLPADYPLVAKNYADKRRDLAKAIGLGRKPRAKKPAKRRA